MPFVFAVLFVLAPLYVWRFSIGGLPTNFLMLASFAVIAIGAVDLWKKGSKEELRAEIMTLGKPMLLGIGLIKVACIIALFAYGISAEKIAQWVVLYVQPLIIFLMLRYFSGRDPKVGGRIVNAAYILLLLTGILALVQYVTLSTLPSGWWGNANEPKRAIAFFAHPNAYALFVTPLLAWLIPNVVFRVMQQKKYGYAVAWLVGALGMFLTLSRGAWLGLLGAAGVYVLLSANKKMFLYFTAALIGLVIVVAAVPNLRYRAILPFYGEKSAMARLSLWETGTKMLIMDEPVKGIILGKGINGFSDNWEKYNTDPNLDHYNFPHNIFLNFWIDLGLLGLLGFVLIMLTAVWQGITNRKNPIALGLALFIVAIVVHGLIDIPYLKNDLALMFWMVMGISFLRGKALSPETYKTA